MKTIEISKDRVLKAGDVVIMTYNAPGATWLKATECAMVESRLQSVEGFYVKSIDYLQPGKVIFEIEVVKTNPIVVTVGYIVAATLGAALIFLAAGWMFEKAELVVTAPATKAISAAALIFAGIMLLSFFKGKGKINAR